MLKGKKILLGVCGSIAAYKSAFLVRLLVKAGAEVQVVMTPAAQELISALTLSTLSKNPVLSKFSDEDGNWNDHVALGLWADVMLIAPTTANTLSKMATGQCNDLLSAVYLSARCPVVVSPAMDLDMWHHPSTQRNISTLKADGVEVIPVNSGELASGLVGEGRMAEPEEIVVWLEQHMFAQPDDRLKGKKVLITAGPTREAIDPVRYITNHSSGKMGFALAKRFAALGAEVTLVKGPTAIIETITGANIVEVTSSEEMYQAAIQAFPEMDIAVMAAAVSDYTPVDPADKKIKKNSDDLTLELRKTKDILAALGSMKKPGQFLVGFALETDNELENAKGKLERKNADMIVLNSLQDKGAGFGHDTNKISVIYRNGSNKHFDLRSKTEVAQDILNEILENYDA